MEIILVNTPPKYGDDWWVNNITYMLDNVQCKYEKISVINTVQYGGVYDKLRIFKEFKEDKQYLYLDLDLVIKKPIDHLLYEDFTILKAWWREEFHTPLNSSIMSWKGDCSYIYKKFKEDPDYYMLKYNRGIDEFLWNELDIVHTYKPVCDSFRYHGLMGEKYAITLFNQSENLMREGWASEYTLSE